MPNAILSVSAVWTFNAFNNNERKATYDACSLRTLRVVVVVVIIAVVGGGGGGGRLSREERVCEKRRRGVREEGE